jgi:hypothetical protein
MDAKNIHEACPSEAKINGASFRIYAITNCIAKTCSFHPFSFIIPVSDRNIVKLQGLYKIIHPDEHPIGSRLHINWQMAIQLIPNSYPHAFTRVAAIHLHSETKRNYHKMA